MSGSKGNRITALYICYWSLRDPLCQSQSLAYLRELTACGHRFALITFEQPKYRLDGVEARVVKRELAESGIHWYPVFYHQQFSVLALSVILLAIYIVIRHRPRIVHSRGSIPATIAVVITRLCRVKFLYDADDRLSEVYADNGRWSRNSFAFRLVAEFERLARKAADSVVVLSEYLREDFIKEFRVRAPIEVIPCCVDVTKFCFNPEARLARRRELGLSSERLFVYAGKQIGPRYLIEEMFDFFKVAKEQLEATRFLILTRDAPGEFYRIGERRGVNRQDYCVMSADRETVVEWLSAADAGLAFIRSVGGERGGSPVKIAEYLATGLPVVITRAIGDYSDLIAREVLGAVVKELNHDCYVESIDRLRGLWAERDSFRERCRAVARQRLSLEVVGVARYRAVYQNLLRAADS